MKLKQIIRNESFYRMLCEKFSVGDTVSYSSCSDLARKKIFSGIIYSFDKANGIAFTKELDSEKLSIAFIEDCVKK